MIGMISLIGCTKTTNNTTVVKDSIYYSHWTELNTQLQVDAQNDSLYVQSITAPSITASIISSGAVIGYYGYPNGSGDTAMFSEAEMSLIVPTQMLVSPGTIQILSVGDLSYSAQAGYLFRYVVIPGDVLAGTSMNGMTQQQLNKMSFSDVQKAISSAKQTSGNTFNP